MKLYLVFMVHFLIGFVKNSRAQQFRSTIKETYKFSITPSDINSAIPSDKIIQTVNEQRSILTTSKEALNAILDEAWEEFKFKFNKTYRTYEEELFRKEAFIENRAKILKANEDYSFGKGNFVMKINSYGDLLHHEFNKLVNGFNPAYSYARHSKVVEKGSAFISSANVYFPKSIDWREIGAVTPVRSQKLCGACWAFAASGAIEGHNFRKTGKLVELSPQNLIDCTGEYGNDGCTGGLTNPAYQYVKDNGGIDTEAGYPYEGEEMQCRYKTENVGAIDTGYVEIPEGDEASLESAVATLGPVSAAIDASRESFQFYSDGVYFDEKCGSKVEEMNHAVLIVGYGTEPDGKQYWLVKNSYGPEWGNGGYIKMAKNVNNHCGIATYASYPLV